MELDELIRSEAAKITDRQRRVIVIETLKGFIEKTPVDNGPARGNWQASMDNPATSELDRGGDKSAEEIGKISGFNPYSHTWIANNLPYIERLENGWSKQAPEGMTALTVAEIKNKYT